METELKVKLVCHTPEPEKLVATAAKLCYSSSSVDELQDGLSEKSINSFVERLMNMHHESPLEHVTFTFAVEGVSRAFTHQLVRHRVASYSQQSQRYVNAVQFSYVVPPAISENPEARERYIRAMEDCQEAYNEIVDLLLMEKCKLYVPSRINELDAPEYLREENVKLYNSLLKECYEDARYTLPNAAETKIIFTMNIRSLFNFLKHRCCDRAQWEIRYVAEVIHSLCKEVAPRLFRYAGPACVIGKCSEGAMCCGHQFEKKQMYA